MERRTVLVLSTLLFTPVLAGCSIADWYNQNGTVRIELAIQGPEGSAIDELRSVKVAIYGISLKQVNAQPIHFAFEEGGEPQPLLVDLVEEQKGDARVPLTEFKTNLLATERVAIRIVTFEAISAAGESLEICNLEDEVERFPCFYQPANSALLYEERPFAPPRGGEVVVGFPVAVAFAQQGSASEYYLVADPSKIVLENSR